MGKRRIAEEYDPGNIFPHLGAGFMTEHGEYRVGEDGKIYGRSSLDGAQIALIAGIAEEDFAEAKSYLETDLKHMLDKLILEKGVKPAKGLHLVIILTDEDADKRGRNGLVSSRLQKISHLD